jgi:hypothetical protein
LVPLEQLSSYMMDINKKFKRAKLEDYVEINIGNDDSKRLIKVGKGTSMSERKDIEWLVREYWDIFVKAKRRIP